MAYIVPNGWVYWDASETKYLTAGQTMPTPAADDRYYAVTSSGSRDDSKLAYQYTDTRTVTYRMYYEPIGPKTYTIPPGWGIISYNYTMSTATVESSIAGQNVVSVYLEASGCQIKTLNIPSTIVALWLYNNTTIQTVTGTITNAMKEIYCRGATSLISMPSMANATNIVYLIRAFQDCSSLTTIPAFPPNVISLYASFTNCTSLQELPSIPSTVMDIGYMCNNCVSLRKVPINNSQIIKWMPFTFFGCLGITDASDFNIPESTESLSSMFKGCSNLITPPSTIRGNNATCDNLFTECTSLITPPIFEGTYANMNTAFYKCSSLKTAPNIPAGSQSMGWTFAECTSLEEVPYIPSTVSSLFYCFYKCTSLTWISMRLNNNSSSSFNSMFEGCTNLTGIIYLGSTYVPPCSRIFYDTTKPIIIGGSETSVNQFVAQQNNNNVYKYLNTKSTSISSVRTDINGTFDDMGEYMQLSIDFTCPVIDYSKLYVPKVYIKNNQIAPIQNWTLTYINEQENKVIKEIDNSTDIEVARVEANEIIANGNFTTLFSANNLSEGAALTIYIPTSNSQVAINWDDTNHQYIIDTVYWGGTLGSAIFTGETFIFDALPDGTAFKIGGPIYEDETGFMVGNINSTPYPSTFNGPATFNNDIYIAIDTDIGLGIDYEIYAALNSLGWDISDNNTI